MSPCTSARDHVHCGKQVAESCEKPESYAVKNCRAVFCDSQRKHVRPFDRINQKKIPILRGSNCAVGLGLNLSVQGLARLFWLGAPLSKEGQVSSVALGSSLGLTVSLHEVASKSILTPRICQHRFGPDRMNWLQTQDGCLMSSFPSLNIRFKRLNPRNFTRLQFFFGDMKFELLIGMTHPCA